MTKIKVLMFSLVLFTPVSAQQVTLQPWVEVFGTVNGQQLGKYVTGITASANLPYKGAVSRVGSTEIYRLNTPTDTNAQQIYLGENMLTGDLNGDGFKDIVVSETVNNYDTVYIYWGTSTGIDTLNSLKIAGENQFDGIKPGFIGDVNNDGSPDLILLASAYPGLLSRGKLYFFLGPVGSPNPDRVLVGDSAFSGLGVNVSVGDLNEDGLNELIVRGKNQQGPPSPQRFDYVNIYWGIGADTINLTLGLQMRTANINSFGLACFDVNGDGRKDLLWTTRDSASWVKVHYGRASFDTVPDLRLRNPGVSDYGFVIINGGDMNGDGQNDIVIGCPDATQTSGFVFVFAGGPGIDGTFDAAVGKSSGGYFGRSVAALGDINGDGLSDIMVGAPRYPYFPPIEYEKGYWGVFKGDSTIRVTDVLEKTEIPSLFHLDEAYPNPFNPRTTIGFSIRVSATISINVYDLLGRQVRTLTNAEYPPGSYTASFDASDLSSGMYYFRMTATKKEDVLFQQTRRFTLLK